MQVYLPIVNTKYKHKEVTDKGVDLKSTTHIEMLME